MQLQTILNRVEKYKSFVYAGSKWREKNVSLEIKIEARRNGKPICSGCGEVAPGYDRQPARDFEYVPLWGIKVYFVYALRRVECRQCSNWRNATATIG